MTDNLHQTLQTLRKTCAPEDLSAARTDSLRASLDATWAEILSRHQSNASGLEVVHALTRRIDDLVETLYREAVADSGAPPPTGYTVLALGGYGRGELNPRSDIDLLFLFQKVRKGDPITRTILHTLWDLNFEIGYSTRSISDSISAAQENTDSLTSMLEARYLAGDRNLAERMEEALTRRFFGRKARGFVNQKIKERRRRHIRAGLSVQLLEPNIKETPGGLRDTHAVGWFLKARRGLKAPEGLLQDHLLNRKSYRLYVDALDFLLRTRNELHFSTGKRYDVLEHDIQPAIACGLGYVDRGHELGVEQFMRDYYLHARNVKHLSDLIFERLKGASSVANRAVGFIVRRAFDDGAVLSRTQIFLPQKRKTFFKDDPYRLLSLFLDAQLFGVTINETAQRAIIDNLHLIDNSLRRSPRAARIFLDILRAPAGVASTLRTMHELGVLGAYIPEFGSLTCLVQYNRYHIYTADEHTLVAIENLEQLATNEASRDDLRPLWQILNKIPRKDLLYLAVLMHDVGKSTRGEDHSTDSANMTIGFLERIGLPQDQIDTVVFLIQNHLTMSHISQRRDLSDDSMIADFARQFERPDPLRMLYLLTYADLSSVTRTAWTAWKGQLLRDLYIKTFDCLPPGGPPAKGRKHRQVTIRNLVEALSDRFDRHTVEEHLRNLPERYPWMNSPEEVETHLRLVEHFGKLPAAVTFSQSGLFSEVTICTRDKLYRLCEICGVLATNDINIFSAQAYTRADGVVIDIFQVTGPGENPEIDSRCQEQVQRQLAEIFLSKASVEDLFSKHQRRWSRHRKPAIRIPTAIHFENEISDQFTVIDIFAQDAVGLLYKITRTLSDLGLDIYTARIGTQADKAVDSFYVSHNGKKVETPEALEQIRKELTSRIGQP